VKKELERGADCNAGRDLGLYTPLHVAAAAVSLVYWPRPKYSFMFRPAALCAHPPKHISQSGSRRPAAATASGVMGPSSRTTICARWA
jgi:hypothetical protein